MHNEPNMNASRNMTTREPVKLLTGYSDEQLDELGGFADDAGRDETD